MKKIYLLGISITLFLLFSTINVSAENMTDNTSIFRWVKVETATVYYINEEGSIEYHLPDTISIPAGKYPVNLKFEIVNYFKENRSKHYQVFFTNIAEINDIRRCEAYIDYPTIAYGETVKWTNVLDTVLTFTKLDAGKTIRVDLIHKTGTLDNGRSFTFTKTITVRLGESKEKAKTPNFLNMFIQRIQDIIYKLLPSLRSEPTFCSLLHQI